MFSANVKQNDPADRIKNHLTIVGADEKIVSDYKEWCLSPGSRYSPAEKGLIGKVLGKAQALIHKAAQKVLARVQAVLRNRAATAPSCYGYEQI